MAIRSGLMRVEAVCRCNRYSGHLGPSSEFGRGRFPIRYNPDPFPETAAFIASERERLDGLRKGK